VPGVTPGPDPHQGQDGNSGRTSLGVRSCSCNHRLQTDAPPVTDSRPQGCSTHGLVPLHLVTVHRPLPLRCRSPGRRTPTTLCPAVPATAEPRRPWNTHRLHELTGHVHRSVYIDLLDTCTDTVCMNLLHTCTDTVCMNLLHTCTDSVYMNLLDTCTNTVYMNLLDTCTDTVYMNLLDTCTDTVYMNLLDTCTDSVCMNLLDTCTDSVYMNLLDTCKDTVSIDLLDTCPDTVRNILMDTCFVRFVRPSDRPFHVQSLS
jgi:hypothetical protein